MVDFLKKLYEKVDNFLDDLIIPEDVNVHEINL